MIKAFDWNSDTLKISNDAIYYNLLIKKRVTLVSGRNGSGRSYLANMIITQQKAALEGIETYDTSNIIVHSLNNQSEAKIYLADKQLIIIDDGEYLISNKLAKYIAGDKKNKYLIFAQGIRFIQVPEANKARFNRINHKIIMEY